MFRATSIFALILLYLALQFVNVGQGNKGPVQPAGGVSLEDARAAGAALEKAPIPNNDPYQLTAALRLKSDAPIPHTARTTPLNRKEGDVDQFSLARFKEKDNITIEATVRHVTDHAYWYVQNGYDVDTDNLRESAKRFEDNIYPTVRQYFGSEWSPGVDGDPRITILTARIPGVGGYFSSADEYVRQVNKFSNEREMIYIAAKPEGLPPPYNFYEVVLAHELQHMVDWNVQRGRDIWIDEGCAETAVALSNYTVDSDESFLKQPDVQLTTWSDSPDPRHYGASYLFVRYLMQHYGGADFLKTLLASPGTGAAAVSGALQRRGYPVGFDDVFKDWVVANYVNDAQVGDGRFDYGGLDERADTEKRIIRYPATLDGKVSQYGADYISLERGTGDTTIQFDGATTAALMNTQAHSGKRIWYSNRRDGASMTLTRAFDLRNVSKATLDYWTWYQIEGDFDYGYVLLSDDGGKTWNTQKTPHTTETNPNGTNYGHGYTGASGRGTDNKQQANWVHEKIDISAHAGKQVMVRFHYVTDTGFNTPGWALDDISVPEIGYSADAENDDGGWEAAGWVRLANAVPQRWFVAAIQYGQGPRDVTVQTMTLDDTQRGSLKIAGFGSQVKNAVLVVAALAPTTTETATYRVQVQRSK